MAEASNRSSAAHADAALEALRDLADSTRSIDDPTVVCSVLGSLHLGLAYLEDALRQVRTHHDSLTPDHLWAGDGGRTTGAVARSQVSWQLRRAEGLAQEIGRALDRAYEGELTIAYDVAAAGPVRSDRPVAAAAPDLDPAGAGHLCLVRPGDASPADEPEPWGRPRPTLVLR